VFYGKPIVGLWCVTSRMRSHNVTYHPTQHIVPHINPSQAGPAGTA